MCHGNDGPDESADAGPEPELHQMMDMSTQQTDARAAPKPTGASRTILVLSKVDSGGSPLRDVDRAKRVYDTPEPKGTGTTFTRDHTTIGWTCLL